MCACVCVLNLPLARNLLQLAGSKSKEGGGGRVSKAHQT